MSKQIRNKKFWLYFLLGILISTTPIIAQNNKDKSSKGTELNDVLSALTSVANVINKNNIVYDRNYVSSNAILHFLKLFDQKAQILTQEEAKRLKDYQNGTYYGTGIKIRMKGGMPLILEVPTNSPAAKAGIKGEAVITAINDKIVTNFPQNEIERLLASDVSCELALTIKSNLRSTETNTVKVKLEPMQLTPAQLEEWNHNINYVKVNYLFPGAGSAISTSIQKWIEQTNSIDGIILDLRGVDGADVSSVVEIASLFTIKDKILFTIRSADGTEQAKYQQKESKKINSPVVVLIDKNTSGTAELLAAILAGTKGVLLIGEETAGDNKVRSFIPFQNGKELYIATGEFVLSKPTQSYANCGVKPHIILKANKSETKRSISLDSSVKATPEEIIDIFGNMAPKDKLDAALAERVQFDPSLRRAVDLLLGLKALNITMRFN